MPSPHRPRDADAFARREPPRPAPMAVGAVLASTRLQCRLASRQAAGPQPRHQPARAGAAAHLRPLSYAGTLRLTVLSDPAQVPDAEMLTAAMRQELSSASGPIGDIDGEPPRAQNPPVCASTWPLDLDPQAARNGGSVRAALGVHHGVAAW